MAHDEKSFATKELDRVSTVEEKISRAEIRGYNQAQSDMKDKIRAAETEAHNKAVEACATRILNADRLNKIDLVYQFRALKRESKQ